MKLKLINILPPIASHSIVYGPMLGTAIVAGLTPEYVNVEIEDIVKDKDFIVDETVDLVGISTITHTSIFAYKISQKYRAIGKKVIIGGMHVTALPDEALKYCDSVVIGEADLVWKSVIDDFLSDKLKPIYKASAFCSMEVVPNGRVDLLDPKNYLVRAAVSATRGCPHKCSFCSVTSFYGNTYRMRSVEKVIEEITSLVSNKICYNFFLFNDDNISSNKKYIKSLLTELKGLNLCWGSQCNLNVAEDPELLKLFEESGCVYLYIGLETISSDNAISIKKSMNDIRRYEDQIKKIRDSGISVTGSFIIGLDCDDSRTIENTVEFVNKTNIDLPTFCMYTPLPGTGTFTEMERDNRILTKDWSKYNVATVVFKPKLMSPEGLQRKYEEAVREMQPRFMEGQKALGIRIRERTTRSSYSQTKPQY